MTSSGTATAASIPAALRASATWASRRSSAASSTVSVPRARNGPWESSRRLSAISQVRPLEPAFLRDDEPSLLVAQVDRDALDPEQRGHAVDGRLERVAQGQARDRLPEHCQERLRPLEVARESLRPLAQAQRVRGTHSEAGEAFELGLDRHGVG